MKLSQMFIFDDDRDLVTINGIKFAGALFRGLTDSFPIGQVFRIEERSDVITVIRLYESAQGESE